MSESLRGEFERLGYDPAYAEIAVEALKRGRRGLGVDIEVQAVGQTTGNPLGFVRLTEADRADIARTVDGSHGGDGAQQVGSQIRTILGQRVAGY